MRTEPIYTDAYIEDQNFSLSGNGGTGIQRKKTTMNPMMLLDRNDYQRKLTCVCVHVFVSNSAHSKRLGAVPLQ